MSCFGHWLWSHMPVPWLMRVGNSMWNRCLQPWGKTWEYKCCAGTSREYKEATAMQGERGWILAIIHLGKDLFFFLLLYGGPLLMLIRWSLVHWMTWRTCREHLLLSTAVTLPPVLAHTSLGWAPRETHPALQPGLSPTQTCMEVSLQYLPHRQAVVHLSHSKSLAKCAWGGCSPFLTLEQQRVPAPSPVHTSACLPAAPSLLLKACMQGSQKQGWALHTHE